MLQYMDFLRASVLQPTDGIRAVGLAYHVTDVFLPELARVVSEGSSKPPQGEILEVLLQPFVDALVAAGEAAPIRRLRLVDIHTTEIPSFTQHDEETVHSKGFMGEQFRT